MAKEANKTDKKPSANSPAAKADAAASFKYGVDYVAEKTGRKATSVRVAFRKHGIEKAEGGVYGWNKQDEVAAVIAKAFPAKAKVEEKPKAKKEAAPKKESKKAEVQPDAG